MSRSPAPRGDLWRRTKSLLPTGAKARARVARSHGYTQALAATTRARASRLDREVRDVTSATCTEESLTSPAFRHWAEEIRPSWDTGGARDVPLHRKVWEWCFIIDVLARRGCLRPGRTGLGFGVGSEPLVSYFARRGVRVVATDLDPLAATEAGWGSQSAGGLAGLNRFGLCDPRSFEELVSFRTVDMTDIPGDLRGFDFTWSSCAFEHLGSIQRGLDFVVAQMDCLATGGTAVHTTEFNVSSNEATVEEGGTVLFRRRDIQELCGRLHERGYGISVDFSTGDTPADRHVDVPPYSTTHLKLELAGYTATSLGLAIAAKRRRDIVLEELQGWLLDHPEWGAT